jgi:hypothetical protein
MKPRWGRRRFVGALSKVSAALGAARTAVWSRAAGAAAAPEPFTVHEADTLRRLSFLFFPYPDLAAANYERVVVGIASAAERDAGIRALAREGVGMLDGGQAAHFLSLDETSQVAALTHIEASAFFRYMLQATRDDLFNNSALLARIGYEGSSLEFGGRLACSKTPLARPQNQRRADQADRDGDRQRGNRPLRVQVRDGGKRHGRETDGRCGGNEDDGRRRAGETEQPDEEKAGGEAERHSQEHRPDC